MSYGNGKVINGFIKVTAETEMRCNLNWLKECTVAKCQMSERYGKMIHRYVEPFTKSKMCQVRRKVIDLLIESRQQMKYEVLEGGGKVVNRSFETSI